MKEGDIYESRTFIGGKVGSFVDKGGNHIEFGLYVFFGHYNDLFHGGDFGPTTGKDGNLKLVMEVVDPNRWSDQTDPESALLLNGPKTNLTGGQIVPKMISGMESYRGITETGIIGSNNVKVTDSAYVKNQLFDDLRPSSAFG
ncbi:zeta-carotene desaturase [Artemisia annua]|uniref:Zeta-carotene desaturase n=1 Tax=Artemisia annua TaxID=35608 RepID=A0A2U1PAZ2_ARTAN|nr:zeta-carotene desaturase [Artemisia annua]